MVIDTNVYLTYIAYNKLYRLLNAIDLYSLSVYINEEMIEEIIRNSVKVNPKDIDNIRAISIPSILAATITFNSTPSFFKSPDPKDNFIFDLAIQTNSRVIVTQEKALLAFAESPIQIKDLKWFKETYPVAL